MAVRPLARTIVLGTVGVVCTGVGWVVGSPPAAGIGVMLVAAIAIDGMRFAIVEARRPLGTVTRSAHPNPCSAGQSMRITLVPGRGSGVDSSIEETLPNELSRHVDVVPPERGSSTLAYDVRAPRRGQWVMGPCFVNRTSSLSLWWCTVRDTSTVRITAWPRTVPMDATGLAHDRDSAVGNTGYVQPHQDNATVRVYNPGDDLRRVHWRSSARLGQLMSRAEEPTDSDHAWAGLHVPSSASAPRRELAISLVASWACEMEAEGYAVDMACAGQTNHGSVDSHLDQLAVLTNADAAKPLPTAHPNGVCLLVTVRGASRMASVPSLTLGRRGVAVVVSERDEDAEPLTSAGWDVLRLDDVTLEEAAERLGQFRASARLAGVA